MKSLVSWVYFLTASVSYQAMADSGFNAYRLGDYTNAAKPLLSKTGNDAVADYYLGRMYLYGYGQLRNPDVAVRYFTKSAQKGYLPAVQVMAKYTLLHDKSPEQAVKWYKKAADQGDVQAQLFLAAAYLYGLGVKKNDDTASHYYIDAAKNGSALAQFALAENFMTSRNLGNKKLGLIWLSKSAASGNPKALTKLGTLYSTGTLVPKNTDKGIDLLTQAAQQNDPLAMVALGNLALSQGDTSQGLEWLDKAAEHANPEVYLQLAHVYLQDKSPLYDADKGFLWTQKAADAGDLPAKKELSGLYLKGIGTPENKELADKWLKQAAQKDKEKTLPLAQAALWLSNGRTDRLEEIDYQMDGLVSSWQNPSTWRTNRYNQAPKILQVTRQDIFKPHFDLRQPNEIPITSYYDALVGTNYQLPTNQWTYPLYPLNPQIESLERVNSRVLAKQDLPAPYLDASYFTTDVDPKTAEIMDLWTAGWEEQANYSAAFNQMYFRAILGDPQAQFEIGQMFQYGVGIAQSDPAATVFYQNAAEQGHLAAEYNLGILYLEHAKESGDYQTAINWLTDSAFKGNPNAQYVLARILDEGRIGVDGKQSIQADHDRALSMLYLSAENGYGQAQYELAEYLAHQGTQGLAFDLKHNQTALIRQLYADAACQGVVQAFLPLAYFNAMEKNKDMHDKAFAIAQSLANNGDERASLLLGMLYDRGLGIEKDPAKAVYWYEQSGANPLSEFILGTYSLEGKGVARNQDKGVSLLQLASMANFADADFNLAVLAHESNQPFLPDLIKSYELGNNHAGILLADYYLAVSDEDGDPELFKKAQKIYTGLAQQGDALAQMKLGYMLDKGLGIPPDVVAAKHWYTASAEQGNPLSQYLLAQLYQVGALGNPDDAMAKYWYQKAAKQLPMASVALGFINETVDENYSSALNAYQTAADEGDAYGHYNLGLMYEYGKGTAVDYPRANVLFHTAADKGLAEAMTQLANLYFYGLGQARDDQLALAWYEKAAALGNTNALYALGLLSETGVVKKLDFQKAINYYQQASNQGNEKAMLALARMYYYGLGVLPDSNQALVLYQRLADRDNAYAQYQLGAYYLTQTAEQSARNKGRFWLEKASQNGNQQARFALLRLEASQGMLSFIEPIQMNSAPPLTGDDADRMYLDALNEWNHGDEVMSRMMLQRLVTQYPDFILGKRAYEQINLSRLSSTTS